MSSHTRHKLISVITMITLEHYLCTHSVLPFLSILSPELCFPDLFFMFPALLHNQSKTMPSISNSHRQEIVDASI